MLDEVEARIAAGPATDLVVLPEASLAGYVSAAGDFDLAPFAEDLDGPTSQRCAAIARARGIHLVAPLVLREPGALYNAMIGYAPDGERTFVYRKRHPWLPEIWATAGPHPLPVVDVAGVRVTIAVCYDVHFVADECATELAAAQLLLFPSAWVERPDNRARHLQQLATQWNLHIINANWAPGVVRIPGQGGSCAIGHAGTVTARAPLAGRFDVVVAV